MIDLYQIHWPNRHVPAFGNLYFDPAQEREQTSVHDQLQALAGLIKAGKLRAIGLSNETPWGVCEFVKQAQRHGLPQIATVQNAYALTNRSVDNALDEVLFREQVSLLAYSPLAFGTLTGKYDDAAPAAADPATGRLTIFESMRNGALGAQRSAGCGQALQQAGTSPRADADSACAGLLRWLVARHKHHHRSHHAGATRRERGCVRYRLVG